MRPLAGFFLLVFSLYAADSSEEKAVVGTVEKLFNGMANHDSEAAKAILLPEGRTVAIRPDGVVNGGSQEQFAARLATMKDSILERMWNPKILIDGRIAHLWAEYDFWRGGKFGHCGIDSVSLVKTPDGWKIAGISYTMQTTGCPPSPLGPPSGVTP